jgi:hypothetical protein
MDRVAGPVRADRDDLGDAAGLPGTPPPPEGHGAILVVSAAVAILHLFIDRGLTGTGVMAAINGLLYLAAPVIIVRHLLLRQTVDTQTMLGAITAYLMIGMSFAFAYRALGTLGAGPFFGSQATAPSPRTCTSRSPP